LEANVVISDLKTLQIKGRTNLPDEIELGIHLSCPEMGYDAYSKAVVKHGQFESQWFSNSSRPLNRLGDGQYVISITTPTVTVLNEAAQKVLGENGKNMTGKLIDFDPVFGNRVRFSKTIDVQ
jgi:hypothetical protein